MKNINSQSSLAQNSALLLLRVIIGVIFVYHGAQKLFGGIDGFAGFVGSIGIPFPHANAWLAAGAEFFGGLALLAGVRVGLAAIPLVITMMVACFAVRSGGFEKIEFPLTLAVVTSAIGLLGAGRFTAGNLLATTRISSEPLDVSQREASFHQK